MNKIYQYVTVFFVVVLAVLIPMKDASEAAETAVPGWMRTIEFKGDLRLRYQLDQNKGKEDRSRGRVRTRLGFESKVTEGLEVGIGFAGGGDNPRSTNQTLENSFDTSDFGLDYFFAEFEASEDARVFAGKFARKEVLWHPSDLLWDGDIRTEGIGATLTVGPFFVNAAGFILDENKTTSDPKIAVIQPGATVDFGAFSIKAALAYYASGAVKGKSLDHSSGSNTTLTVTDPADATKTIDVLKFDYDSIVPSLEVAAKEPFGGAIPHASVFAEYVNNSDPSDKNTGFLAGFRVGNKKVQDQKEWQFTYLYRRLEKDAWLDILPDSDFAGGKTGYKGHELIAQIGLKKHVIFGLDYYKTEEINGKKEEDVLQVDILMKF